MSWIDGKEWGGAVSHAEIERTDLIDDMFSDRLENMRERDCVCVDKKW